MTTNKLSPWLAGLSVLLFFSSTAKSGACDTVKIPWHEHDSVYTFEEDGDRAIKIGFLVTQDAAAAIIDAGRTVDFHIEMRLTPLVSGMQDVGITHDFVQKYYTYPTTSQAVYDALLPEWRWGGSVWCGLWRTIQADSGIRSFRDDNNLDLVFLLMDKRLDGVTLSKKGCAHLTRGTNYIDVSQAYGAAHYNLTRGIRHEIGHLLGADHDRHAVPEYQECEETPYYRCAYVKPTYNFRTLMAYHHGCPGCAHLELFSTPDVNHPDIPVALGWSASNNACAIEHLGDYIADFSRMEDEVISYYTPPLPTTSFCNMPETSE